MPSATSPLSSSPSKVSVLSHIDDNQQNCAEDSQESKVTPTSSGLVSSASSAIHHKSVKSITREYEVQQRATTTTTTSAAASIPTLLSPPLLSLHSTESNSVSPVKSHFLSQQRRGSFEASSSPSLTSSKAHSHSRRASVLLASANYPSTLSTGEVELYSRPRTISSSSITAKDRNRSTSLKLASAAYPSSYQTYTRNTKSSGGLSPLPLPVMAATDVFGSAPSSMSLPMLSVSLNEEEDVSTESGEENDMVADLSPSPTSKASLSKMTAAERREHSRKHSRVHSRNLSVFFPRPDTLEEKEADKAQAANQFASTDFNVKAPDLSPSREGTSTLSSLSPSSGINISPTNKSNRGHHRKHSVNHALLTPNRHDQVSRNASYSSSTNHQEGEKQDYLNDSNESPTIEQALSTPLWQAKGLTSLPASHRPLLVFGAMHFILGATLWTKGQSGDSLSLTGLGYLVVFDACGILNGVVSETMAHGWKHQDQLKQAKQLIRKPFGPYRVETVLQFSQTIFLLFASIYVCKESVEHALLEGSQEHHEEDDNGLILPWLLLAFTTAACLFTNMILQTHDKLIAACGIATMAFDSGSNKRRSSRGHGRAHSILVDPSTLAGPFLHLFANPFSITVLYFCLTLTCAAVFMPPFQVAALDKVLAGLESVAMLYIAYPASKALGKILLQTAPKSFNTQNVQLLRSIKTIEEHSLVTYVAPPHLWQLTPPTSALHSNQYGKGNGALLGSQRLAKNASLIATVEIFLKEDASDVNVLEVTRWAWTLLAPAVGAGAGLQAGESLRGAIRAGEVTVQVSREGQKDRYRKESHSECYNHHHHRQQHQHHGLDDSDKTHLHSHNHEQASHPAHHHHDQSVPHAHPHSHSHTEDAHPHSHSSVPSHIHPDSHNSTHKHSHGHESHGKHIHSH